MKRIIGIILLGFPYWHLSFATDNFHNKGNIRSSRVATPNTYNILDFGATHDTTQFSTLAIQNAIDTCTKQGGGVVQIPAGAYKTGCLQLKSNVTLEIQRGGVLYGDPNVADYTDLAARLFGSPSWHRALISANYASNIGIIGPGMIDGQGGKPSFRVSTDSIRPRLIYFVNCNNVTVTNVTLQNPALWTQFYLQCNTVLLDRITVYSFSNTNNDGIDIDAQNAVVSNCHIQSGDDGICLKSYGPLPCSNVEIYNCFVSSSANAIKLGTTTNAGFNKIYIHNCTITNPRFSPFLNWSNITAISNPLTNISGLALEMVDGGVMDDVTIDTVNMTGIMNPVSLFLGDRSRLNPDGKKLPGTMQNISISNVTAVGVTTRMTSSVSGNNYYDKTSKQQVTQTIKNVRFTNVSFLSPGNSTSQDTSLAPVEPAQQYPEIYNLSPIVDNRRFNTMPAYGMFIRHAEGVTIDKAAFSFQKPDLRPVFYLNDVKDLAGQNITYQTPSGGGALVRAIDTSNIRLEFLPVLALDFVSFSGQTEPTANHLYWQVDAGASIKEFVVQRKDGAASAFADVGYVRTDESGNSNEYGFSDELINLYEAIVSYRIREVKFNGDTTYSKTVVLHRNTPGRFIRYVALQGDALFIQTNASDSFQTISAELVDISGRTIMAQPIPWQSQKLSIASLSRGVYILRLRAPDHEQFIYRFVK